MGDREIDPRFDRGRNSDLDLTGRCRIRDDLKQLSRQSLPIAMLKQGHFREGPLADV